jgi:hypothetical protein
MEKLVDRFLRDAILVLKPLHPNHHAYQAGKSVEMALHQLVVQVEKVLDQQEIALGIFLDIEGAFNNTSYDSMCATLARHGVDAPLYDGLEPPWRVGWPRRLWVDSPAVWWCLVAAHREVFCHLFYGALLSIN